MHDDVYKKRVALVYLSGLSVDLISVYISNIAFPDIGAQLHASVRELAWVANGYTLGMALIIPLSAWLSECLGAKRTFLISLSAFSLAALLAGLSHSILQLIGWRIAQGLSGGLLIPLGQALAYGQHRPDERARLSAMVMGVATIATAISPVFGGMLTQHLNWRWNFFINIPLAACAMALAWRWLKPDMKPMMQLNIDHDTKFDTARRGALRLDWVGMVLISFALSALLYGLSLVQTFNDARPALQWILLGAVGLFLFAVNARRCAYPLFDLRVLRQPLLWRAMMMYIALPGTFTGVNVVNMAFYQQAIGLSAVKIGLLMMPFSIGAFVALQLAGRLFNRIGPRNLLLSGIAIFVTGLYLLNWVDQGAAFETAFAAYLLMGFGVSFVSGASQTMALLHVNNEQMPKVSALWNLNRQLSLSLGVAFFAAMLTLNLGHANVAFAATQPLTIMHALHRVYWIGIIVCFLPIIAIARLGPVKSMKLI